MEFGKQLWFTAPKVVEVRKIEDKVELKSNEVIVGNYSTVYILK